MNSASKKASSSIEVTAVAHRLKMGVNKGCKNCSSASMNFTDVGFRALSGL
jgi:hypothetical protein